MPYLSTRGDGSVVLKIHVQPRATQNRITGLQDGALKLRLSAPPVDGKANRAVLAFFAELFHQPKSGLSLLSGEQSRRKTVLVSGMSEAAIRTLLAPYLA